MYIYVYNIYIYICVCVFFPIFFFFRIIDAVYLLWIIIHMWQIYTHIWSPPWLISQSPSQGCPATSAPALYSNHVAPGALRTKNSASSRDQTRLNLPRRPSDLMHFKCTKNMCSVLMCWTRTHIYIYIYVCVMYNMYIYIYIYKYNLTLYMQEPCFIQQPPFKLSVRNQGASGQWTW